MYLFICLYSFTIYIYSIYNIYLELFIFVSNISSNTYESCLLVKTSATFFGRVKLGIEFHTPIRKIQVYILG